METHNLRFKQVNKAAGELMSERKHVFSPISHTHPIAEETSLPLGWDYWEQYDRRFIEMCDEMYILMLDGWEDSIGVQAEIKIAKELGKKITYIDKLQNDFESVKKQPKSSFL